MPALAREIADVTCAGDSVIAVMAAAIAAGASASDAASLANHAAGIVVGRLGPAAATHAELLDAVSASLAAGRANAPAGRGAAAR